MKSARSPQPRSLKSRALQLLAQREQSRVELRRKLMTHALAEDRTEAARSEAARAEDVRFKDVRFKDERAHDLRHEDLAMVGARGARGARGAPEAPAAPDVPDPPDAAARVEAVLTWLDGHGFLSDERFAESRVNARSARYGNLRIRQELKQHAVALPAEALQALDDSEFDRALAVWERRFGLPPQTAEERGRQGRFLSARGFSSDVVQRLLRTRRHLEDASGRTESGN